MCMCANAIGGAPDISKSRGFCFHCMAVMKQAKSVSQSPATAYNRTGDSGIRFRVDRASSLLLAVDDSNNCDAAHRALEFLEIAWAYERLEFLD